MVNKLKNLGWLFVLALVSVGATGCRDFTSPQGVVRTAVSAVRSEKLKTFRKTLKGEALDQYGSLAGMGSLQKELAPLDLKFGTVEMVREDRDASSQLPVARVFALEVLAREKQESRKSAVPYELFKKLQVECSVSHVWVRPGPDFDGNCGTFPRPGFCQPAPQPSYREERQVCAISRVENLD